MADTYEYLLQDEDSLKKGTTYKCSVDYTTVPFFAPDATLLKTAFAQEPVAFRLTDVDMAFSDNSPDFTFVLKDNIQSISAGSIRIQISNVLQNFSDSTVRVFGINVNGVREIRATPVDPNAPIQWQTLLLWVTIAAIIIAIVYGVKQVREIVA